MSVLLILSFVDAKSVNNMSSVAVAKTVGYTMSNQVVPKSAYRVTLETQILGAKLSKRLEETGFSMKSIFVDWFEQNGSQLNVRGFIMHSDHVDRMIHTQFEAACTMKNRHSIVIHNVELSNSAKPRAAFFMAPANRLDIDTLEDMTFAQALMHVQSVSKKLNSYDVQMDVVPQEYHLIAFMMNKLDNTDKIFSNVSMSAYSAQGEQGQLIQTQDKWYLTTVKALFAYNNAQAYYFNILWEKDKKIVATHSYSTHGLIKEIQKALSIKGYDVGNIDGHLSTQTKSAISQYIKTMKFDKNTKISSSLLWFMQQSEAFNIPKIIQATLLQHGKKIGRIDGQIGRKTIRALKSYQKLLGVKQDGKITPALVYMLLQTSQNVEVYQQMRTILNAPIPMERHTAKMWPNEI